MLFLCSKLALMVEIGETFGTRWDVMESLECKAQDFLLDCITVVFDYMSVMNALSQPFAWNFNIVVEELKASADFF
jgi:hypothetical protein